MLQCYDCGKVLDQADGVRREVVVGHTVHFTAYQGPLQGTSQTYGRQLTVVNLCDGCDLRRRAQESHSNDAALFGCVLVAAAILLGIPLLIAIIVIANYVLG